MQVCDLLIHARHAGRSRKSSDLWMRRTLGFGRSLKPRVPFGEIDAKHQWLTGDYETFPITQNTKLT